jgi:DNA-binding transcriptional MerR regulator
MKKLIAIVTLALIAAGGALAQETDAPFLERLGLSEEQIEEVLEIQQETQEETRLARAELDLLRARLTRELVESEPDRQEIRNILRESVEWEYQLRLARVEAELDIREVVGDRTWGRIVQARDRQRGQQAPGRN